MADRRLGAGGRNNGPNDDKNYSDNPPMSRLFIVCSKTITENDLRQNFNKFGDIEEIWIVKDRVTGEAKGVAYIKFSKTSEAAKALDKMHGSFIGEHERAIKVLVAANRQQGAKKFVVNEEEKYLRLFVIVPKDMSEESLKDEFSEFGEVEHITVLRDKVTKEGKGFAYIKFTKFVHAALAFEGCGSKYKAVFAEPKPSRNNSNSTNENFGGFGGGNSGGFSDLFGGGDRRSGGSNGGGNPPFGGNDRRGGGGGTQMMMNDRRSGGNDYGFNSFSNNSQGNNSNDNTLTVLCSPLLNQDQLWRLFDIIPGLDYCQINNDFNNRNVTATVVYNNNQSAVYAKDKIHGLEYPTGERLIVRMGHDSVGNMCTLDPFNGNDRDAAFCNVPLPPAQPLANINATCAQRCFIVCVPKSLPTSVLKQTFCRLGDLIDVYLLPNKNCGYAKYATEEAAKKAIKLLHGAEILGVRLKVLEAEEPNNDRRKRMRHDERMDNE